VDFYCAACKVEVDGGQHFSPEGLIADAERTVFLEGLGLRVIRLTNIDVLGNLDGVRLSEALTVSEY
jgi:very-short-patch-repair endonuclease